MNRRGREVERRLPDLEFVFPEQQSLSNLFTHWPKQKKYNQSIMDNVQLLGSACFISSFFFQLIGLQICYSVIKKGATGDMSPFTFICYGASCLLWLKYAIIREDPYLVGNNMVGGFLNWFYVIVFYRYSSKRSQFHQYLLVGAMLLLTPLMYVKYYQTNAKLVVKHLGAYCVFMSVMCYGAPLVSLGDIIRSKSTESLSLLLTTANLALAGLWTLYGVFIGDSYVQAPNFVGGSLSVIQLALFCIYPRRREKSRVIQT